jgi:surface polysaccharide O-acyltransferase-like enzyme
MEHTDEQLDGIKADFARRKRNQFIVAVPLVLLIAGFVLFEEQLKSPDLGVPSGVFVGVLLVVVISIGGFSFRNWRCPACDGYLGKSTSMNNCSKCGVALK